MMRSTPPSRRASALLADGGADFLGLDVADGREHAAGGADRAGDEDGMAVDLAGVAGDARGLEVDVADAVLEAVAGEAVAVGAEGVGAR